MVDRPTSTALLAAGITLIAAGIPAAVAQTRQGRVVKPGCVGAWEADGWDQVLGLQDGCSPKKSQATTGCELECDPSVAIFQKRVLHKSCGCCDKATDLTNSWQPGQGYDQ